MGFGVQASPGGGSQVRRWLLPWVAIVGALTLASCDEPSGPRARDPGVLSAAGGDTQAGAIGQTLPDSLVVRVVDAAGRPEHGVRVEWQVVEGGGSVNPRSSVTDAAGYARTIWTLGTSSGQHRVVAMASGGRSLSFLAQAEIRYQAVSAGLRHTCALDGLGEAWCWGLGRWGQLGTGDDASRPSPARVGGGWRFQALEAGWQHTCGVSGTAIVCWGEGADGQLGDGDQALRRSPVAVQDGPAFAAVAPGGVHTCGLTTAGAVYCWGSNGSGQLGAPSGICQYPGFTGPCSATPLLVPLPTTASAIAAGDYHSCALLTDGRAYCWGRNEWGQTGVGRFSGGVARPEPVAGDLRFASLTAGTLNTCAIATGGQGYCWGRGGMLGTGAGLLNYDRPAAIGTSLKLTRIDLGEAHGCALAENGMLLCWGSGHGPAMVPSSALPTPVPAAASFRSFSAGGAHVCAADNEAIYCWGANTDGQLGRPELPAAGSADPVRVLPALGYLNK